ncbi:MAG TPA: HAD-IIB family hydrolase [Opitutaceae bacterium]|nr:HAD-IIB family hydrolase [Opitutaceae bacterium]
MATDSKAAAPPTPGQVRLFCSDVDGTLVGNPEASQRFKEAWERLPVRRRPLLAYNSGRLIDDLQRFYAEETLLARPDFAIGGVGTQIYDERAGRMLEEYFEHLAARWDPRGVQEVASAFPGVRPQPPEFQHTYKSSWFLEKATPEIIQELRQRLADAGLEAEVVYSSARDLDILPGGATKGGALKWLCDRLKIPPEEVVVAGDTGNDNTMFLLPGVRRIIVENAQPELLEATVHIPTYTSRLVMADGVLDGLRHFGVLTRLPTAGDTEISGNELEPSFRMLFTGSQLGPLSDEEKELLLLAYEKALVALRKNITPLGFSACSLADNSVTGTDANYRSVWARDGALTLAQTLELEGDDIRACQRATLDTLLNTTSPTGQLPSNVRIDDGMPEYSGVGNIAAVDSGLWVIIAFYEFIEKTRDLDYLRHHAPNLQLAMNWLSAHDSNNDGLLEIPEAGDWTDLFGRSYNVLYDEVLWFRANVCFGRLLEYQGDTARAADYLRWSQRVQGRVLDAFWPTTRAAVGDPRPHRFADRQFDLGDTQYLLAEITPFSFNWRCDVLGNLLAFLANLLDVTRARTALRFMWGVGVNHPWPVANLYPVVQAGDPDWRPYYTVNLLNLPHHYHNGGIWPFIGGLWVRFLHRLGFHEVACRELVRLAQLNQLGRDQEWEFNEWAHGVTGRPMGKAFQAWSAASFIRACQEVEADPAHQARDRAAAAR